MDITPPKDNTYVNLIWRSIKIEMSQPKQKDYLSLQKKILKSDVRFSSYEGFTFRNH